MVFHVLGHSYRGDICSGSQGMYLSVLFSLFERGSPVEQMLRWNKGQSRGSSMG